MPYLKTTDLDVELSKHERLRLLLDDDDLLLACIDEADIDDDVSTRSKAQEPAESALRTDIRRPLPQIALPLPTMVRRRSKSSKGSNKALKSATMQYYIGYPADAGQAFCPVTAISKYPYQHMKRSDLSADVANHYFVDGRFWRRNWDIYYVWPPYDISKDPLYLVLANRVNEMLQEINQQFGCSLALDAKATEEGLVLSFPSHPDLRPRFLGTINSVERFHSLQNVLPSAAWRCDEETLPQNPPSGSATTLFRQVTDLGMDAANVKRKLTKEQKKLERVSKQQSWLNDLKTLEHFLGLRPKNKKRVLTAEEHLTLPWAEMQAYHDSQKPKPLAPIDPDLPAPYPFHTNVVFVCTDLECYERDRTKITEIGFATLDTYDLQGLAPGPNGENWRRQLKACHMRIREHAHLNNTEFVNGCADMFQFGNSEIVTLKEAPKMVANYFRGAASQRVKDVVHADDDSGNGFTPLDNSNNDDAAAADAAAPQRTLVLVGHDVNNDIAFLRKLGYDVTNLSNLRTLDTSILHRAYTHNWNPAKLSLLLEELDIEPWYLHNAGNDAVYTLQALLGLGVRSAAERGREEERVRGVVEQRAKMEAEKAAKRVYEEAEGWGVGGLSLAEKEEVDGGVGGSEEEDEWM